MCSSVCVCVIRIHTIYITVYIHTGTGIYNVHIQYPTYNTPTCVQALRPQYTPVQLFVVVGGLCVAALWSWAAGTTIRRSHPYTFTLTMPAAEGMRRGVPLR